MKTVSVMSSRDGDALQVSESPWPRVLIGVLVARYNPRWGFDYRIWNAILGWVNSKDELLVSLPVAHSCDVSQQLWGNPGLPCWHTDEDADGS